MKKYFEEPAMTLNRISTEKITLSPSEDEGDYPVTPPDIENISSVEEVPVP